MSKKPVLFSGIQPSGLLTIAHYIGAIQHWVKLQSEYDSYFCLVDLHAITVRQDPVQFNHRCYDLLASYIACGLDPKENIIFAQSHVPHHAELAWILNCFTLMGELSRMTQFKDKSSRFKENINAGLLTYPILMAADILLYQTEIVPVGEDQKQHLELTRDIAQRFNRSYGETFTIPEPYIAGFGSRIMSLENPTRKMSKSEGEQSYIGLLDTPDDILQKLKRAVTDSGKDIRYHPEEKPGVSNLLVILSSITKKSIEDLEKQYIGKGYGQLKQEVADALIVFLKPIQERFHKVREDKAYMDQVLLEGAKKAKVRAQRTLKKVNEALGFLV
jgi:tryptophanyl-tRNA synthetase